MVNTVGNPDTAIDTTVLGPVMNSGAHDPDCVIEAGFNKKERFAGFAGRIRSHLPQDWINTRAALSSLGINVTIMTPGEAGKKLADLLGDYAAQEDLTAEQLANLDTYFEFYGNDSEAMSALVDRLGPDKIRDVLTRFAFEADSPLNSEDFQKYAGYVRTAMEIGTAAWDPNRASDFINALITPRPDSSSIKDSSVIAYLFGDGGHMSANLALAAARRIYEIESNGKPALGADDMLANSLFTPPADLSALDPASAIYKALGRFPTAAADFLWADDKPDSALIKFLFGKQGARDGYEGALALLQGATRIPGGPLDGDNPIDPGAWDRVARFTSIALRQLCGFGAHPGDSALSQLGKDYRGDYLSDQAKTRLAFILATHMPGFLDTPLTGTASQNDPYATSDVFTVGQRLNIPNLSLDQLTTLLGVAGSSPGGDGILMHIQGKMQESYRLFLLGCSPELRGEYLDKALAGLTTLDGVLTGTAMGLTLKQAQHGDAWAKNRQADIDAAINLLGNIPIGGAVGRGAALLGQAFPSIGGGIGGALTKQALGQGLGKIRDVSLENLGWFNPNTGTLERVETTMPGSLREQKALHRYRTMQLAADVLGYPGLPRDATDEEAIAAVIAEHSAAIDALLRASAGEPPALPGENLASEHSLDHIADRLWALANGASTSSTEH
ncbi:hypothetical protein [Mycetocola spongiae]|uniref:hypothetical protein n=1 Tax=Mycetocola spongiae TaxID=2859226 RepID=UPI001CF3A144|nr:hypothetical protein [Mycetocola spongiae]UCR89983.1 hypothetical protein KXZ72_04780 [Mycetocola spongiae]